MCSTDPFPAMALEVGTEHFGNGHDIVAVGTVMIMTAPLRQTRKSLMKDVNMDLGASIGARFTVANYSSLSAKWMTTFRPNRPCVLSTP